MLLAQPKCPEFEENLGPEARPCSCEVTWPLTAMTGVQIPIGASFSPCNLAVLVCDQQVISPNAQTNNVRTIHTPPRRLAISRFAVPIGFKKSGFTTAQSCDFDLVERYCGWVSTTHLFEGYSRND